MSRNNSLSVLHISTPNSWRGGEQQLYYLMEELEILGLRQFVFCTENGAFHQKARERGWNVIPFKKNTFWLLTSAFRLKDLCRSLGINVIHTHDSKGHTLAHLSSSIFRNETPIVVSRRVDFPIGKNWLSSRKYNASSVAKIICVSKAIENIMKPAIVQKQKLCTIHSGIDLSRFTHLEKGKILREKFSIPESDFLIGNTSALAPHKDYYTWVDSAEILIKENFPAQFVIMGDGPLLQAIQSYVQEKNLQHKIFFNGFDSLILPLLKELDLFLITSTTEGLGTSILDAFACDVPVVATQAGGIPEIVIHEKTGLLSPIQNPTDLANNIKKLLSNSELKQQLLSNSKALLQSFSKTTTAQKTLEVYKEVIK